MKNRPFNLITSSLALFLVASLIYSCNKPDPIKNTTSDNTINDNTKKMEGSAANGLGTNTHPKKSYDRIKSQEWKNMTPKVGTKAPDFTLYDIKGKKPFTLSQRKGKSPVALIFGSYT